MNTQFISKTLEQLKAIWVIVYYVQNKGDYKLKDLCEVHSLKYGTIRTMYHRNKDEFDNTDLKALKSLHDPIKHLIHPNEI